MTIPEQGSHDHTADIMVVELEKRADPEPHSGRDYSKMDMDRSKVDRSSGWLITKMSTWGGDADDDSKTSIMVI